MGTVATNGGMAEKNNRGVAQLASAPALGAGGREFESRRPDHTKSSVNFYDRVYRLVKMIPRGNVATYGQIAALIGSPRGARMVGWAMHAMDGGRLEEIPWQRVINREGRISTTCLVHPPDQQAQLLRKDGVEVVMKDSNFFVDLEKYLWHP